MDQPGRRSGHSPPTTYQLPPLRSLSSNSGHRLNTTQAQRENTASLDVCQTLRQQIHVLRAEKDRIHSSHEQLKTKSHVMDRELAVLTEEQEKLRKEASKLSSQVESLTKEKEQLQHRSQADAAQWQQIMSMSSRLQTQSVEETRRFNAEREAWTRERVMLEWRLSDLQDGTLRRTDRENSSSMSSGVQRSPTLSPMEVGRLRQEINSLRERCVGLEEILSALMKESASIDRIESALREARRRIGSTAARTSSDHNSDPRNV